MIVVEIRPRADRRHTIAVHPRVTILGGLDPGQRSSFAADLTKALRGEPCDLEVDIDVDGHRQRLTPELARRLGLDAEAPAGISLFPADLPGARPARSPEPAEPPQRTTRAAPEPVVEPPDEGKRAADANTAEVTAAAAALAELRSSLERAEAEATSVGEALAVAGDDTRAEAKQQTAVAEDRLAGAEVAAASARRLVDEAREAERARDHAAAAASDEARAELGRLEAERRELELARVELVARLAEFGDPGDPTAIEEALVSLRRLRQLKPKPPAIARAVVERWTAAARRLDEITAPPQPPDWLVAPALAALHEARAGLAAVESGKGPAAVAPSHVAALDRAHREVLEAEQRAMRKGSRLNRRRLETAQAAEKEALGALGVSSYGEYLQHVAPTLDAGPSQAERIAAAGAAVADAEAVWDELHGGQASPEWMLAREEHAIARAEAIELIGREVPDQEIAAVLLGQVEEVVDTEWAALALGEALRGVGAALQDGDDVEAIAVFWLEEVPRKRDARGAVEAELSGVDAKLLAVEEQLTERASAATVTVGRDGPPEERDVANESAPIAALEAAAADAESAERDAASALAGARAALADAEQAHARREVLEEAVDERRGAVERVRARADAAELRLNEASERAAASTAAAVAEAARRQEARRAAAEAQAHAQSHAQSQLQSKAASDPARASRNGEVDLSAVVGMEAQVYVVARLAALRGAPGGPLPLLFDARVADGLAAPAAKRLLGLLERVAPTMQVVVLGDDGPIAEWARGLAGQAAVRAVAR